MRTTPTKSRVAAGFGSRRLRLAPPALQTCQASGLVQPASAQPKGCGYWIRNLKVAATFVFLCCSLSFAEDGHVGTTGSQFLGLGVGARGIAMGEAYTSVVSDASALYWNPAGMLRVPHISATMMHAVYLADISYDYVSYVHRYDHRTVLGGALQYVDYGAIDRTDINSNLQGEFHPVSMVASVGVAHAAPAIVRGVELYSGITAKFIYSKIVENASGFAFDIGFQGSFGTAVPSWASFVVQNLGQGLKFDKARDSLPVTVRLGGAALPARGMTVSVEGVYVRGGGPFVAVGFEQKMEGESVSPAFRLGYNTRVSNDLEGFRGVSFGLGLSLVRAGLDYAFVPFGDLGQSHRASLTFTFGRRTNKRTRYRY